MSLFMFAFAGLAPIGGLFAGWLMEVGGTQLALSTRRLAVAGRRRVCVDSAGRADARAQSPMGLSIWRSEVIVSTSSRS